MAVPLNLLDWRRERERQKTLVLARYLIVAAGFAAAGVIVAAVITKGQIENQIERNDIIKSEQRQIEQQIREVERINKLRADLMSRIAVVETLQINRAGSVHLFTELAMSVPEGIFLTGIKQTGKTMLIDGMADSSGRVSSYLRILEANPWFADPVLVIVKTAEKAEQRNSEFQISLTTRTIAEERPEEAAESENPVPLPPPPVVQRMGEEKPPVQPPPVTPAQTPPPAESAAPASEPAGAAAPTPAPLPAPPPPATVTTGAPAP